MFHVIVGITIFILGLLILSNLHAIKKLEKRHDQTLIELTTRLQNLNSKVKNVISTNNTVSSSNIKSLLTKINLIEETSLRTDNKMQLEIDNLRRQLTYLIENNKVYNMILEDKEVQLNNQTATNTSTNTSSTTIQPITLQTVDSNKNETTNNQTALQEIEDLSALESLIKSVRNTAKKVVSRIQ